MTESAYNPWLHRVAVLTACVALLPIGMGALVTTRDAGMAFRDWPTSDGYGMFSYPWLQSVGDKFLEHGHRLAGVLIGLASIALCVAAAFAERRNWVKALAVVALLAVIAQGLLGGQRVRLDARGLAFVHGSFAALVYALLASIAVVTSRRWRDAATIGSGHSLAPLQVLAIATAVCVFVQYVLGGLLRHQGLAPGEHLGFAFIAALMVVWLALAATASGIHWFRAPAAILAVATLAQLGLGAGAWFTKFGFGDQVAVHGSPMQVAMRTSHVLMGMLLFATTIVLAVRVCRMQWLHGSRARRVGDQRVMAAPVAATGVMR
ncbi:MAG: hypothetical protein EXS05_07110 [Planctomycetaceae bacterium]|nr:hypothetical protein [Planctomycetaceae bacterium]